jgi:hypothetical protein
MSFTQPSYTQQPSRKLNRYSGIQYELVDRIGDVARRAFYPQQAATLKSDEVQRLNAELELIAEKMESINTWMDAVVKRAAAGQQ